MEYLDTYDEAKNFLGKRSRDYVHKNALWHNTVHCWLYDKNGNVYFQIRKGEGKLYTTASGHVLAGETIAQAFGREVAEETGVNINQADAELVNVYIFKMDKLQSDGSMFRDRAFSNVYICEYSGDENDLQFDLDELDGLAKVNAKQTLELFKKGKGKIPARIIKNEDGKNVATECDVCFSDFLVNEHETAIDKYGDVLEKVIKNIQAD